jgi:tetratricopeptide (TPR) repeat protein
MNAADWANKLYNDKEYLKCSQMAFPQQTDPNVLFYAALSLEALDKKHDAIAMLRRTLFHKPDHERALRSFAWNDAPELDRLGALEKMAKLGVCELDDYCQMGHLYNECNRLNEAHHWYQMALEKEPRNTLAMLGVAEIHVKLAVRYIQDTENAEEIDLGQQMSDSWDAEEVMRFIYDNITEKMCERVMPSEEEDFYIPQA